MNSDQYMILNALLHGDNYGGGICDKVAKMTGGKVVPNHSSIYTTLETLVCAGLIKQHRKAKVKKGRGRARKYYQLTAKGRSVVQQHRKVWLGVFGWEPCQNTKQPASSHT